ncbi:hypothetical protein LINGRAHAP2_LOCUS22037 [Linum grandiflorum]
MTTVLEYRIHGRPRYVGNLSATGFSSGDGRILEPWMENPVCSNEFCLPCAVIVLICPSIGRRTKMRQFWKTAAALPKIKSTVPERWHSRKNWRWVWMKRVSW